MYMHEDQKVAHLDVKPENILLDANQMAKLCDFDTVLPIGTRLGKMRGTLEYHPPENFKPCAYHTVDAQGDSWALGLIAYVQRNALI